MIKISAKELIERGFHIGHKKNKWNPKMKKFIYAENDGIHIINIKDSAIQIQKALMLFYDTLLKNKPVLFVCTKLHTKSLVKNFCIKNNFPYVTERWIGGTITNFDVIKKRIKDYLTLKSQYENDTLEVQTKKEKSILIKKLQKMETNFSGLINLKRTPYLVIIFDTIKDKTALMEASKSGCKTICIVDTNSDPSLCTIPIPGNDDSVETINYILSLFDMVIDKVKKGDKNSLSNNLTTDLD